MKLTIFSLIVIIISMFIMKRQTISHIRTMVIFLTLLVIGGCGGGIEKYNTPKVEMVFVKGGTFFMGCTPEQTDDCKDNEKPVHYVTIGDFYIGKYEVTQWLWELVMNGVDYKMSYVKGWEPSCNQYFKGNNLPITLVDYEDVSITFISRLNLMTGKNYRLPTEAEWEYAARGGNKGKGYKYSGSNNIDSIAWYYKNSGDSVLDEKSWDYHKLTSNNNRPHPVGTKLPNELGIYDMSGNVWEWVNDKYDDYTADSKMNPQGPLLGNYHIFRGGSWSDNIEFCRISNRSGNKHYFKDCNVGFRLALSP